VTLLFLIVVLYEHQNTYTFCVALYISIVSSTTYTHLKKIKK